jgi:toxin ParE1/3/4
VGTRIRWSRNAILELAEIRDYIGRDSPAMAVRVGRQLVAATRRLGAHPLSGRVVEVWKRPERRELIVGSYRVMYRVSFREITVFSVRHTRRRVPKGFRKEWLQ